MSETWMFLKAKKLKSFKSFTFTHFLYPQTHTCSLVPNTLHNLYYSSAWEVLGFEIHCRLAFQSCFYRHKSWSPQPRVDFWVFLWCFEYNLITLSCVGPLIGLTCRFPILIWIYVSYYVEYWNLIVYVMNLIKSFGIVLRGKGSYLNLTSAWLDFLLGFHCWIREVGLNIGMLGCLTKWSNITKPLDGLPNFSIYHIISCVTCIWVQ